MRNALFIVGIIYEVSFFSGCPLNYDGICLRNGTDVLQNYFYRTSTDTIWIDYFGLVALAIVMNFIGYIGVRRMVNKLGYY